VGIRLLGVVLPGEDEETVETAERGEEERQREQSETKVGLMSNCRDEDGGGEANADGELFRKAMRAFTGVNENEVSEDKTAENQVKMNCFR
jgi:hypothetical protein